MDNKEEWSEWSDNEQLQNIQMLSEMNCLQSERTRKSPVNKTDHNRSNDVNGNESNGIDAERHIHCDDTNGNQGEAVSQNAQNLSNYANNIQDHPEETSQSVSQNVETQSNNSTDVLEIIENKAHKTEDHTPVGKQHDCKENNENSQVGEEQDKTYDRNIDENQGQYTCICISEKCTEDQSKLKGGKTEQSQSHSLEKGHYMPNIEKSKEYSTLSGLVGYISDESSSDDIPLINLTKTRKDLRKIMR
jgi:hypothetical protein